MHIFYQSNIEQENYLSSEESKHAIKVLRLSTGDKIQVFDGKGSIFTAEISSNKGKAIKITILKKEEFEKRNDFSIHIAITPTKNINRFEWFLEKTTEIGINEISPILCERSERKIINNERLERILIAAIKQSKNPFLPKLNELISFDNFLSRYNKLNGYIAHCNNDNMISLKNQYKKNSDALILIGPEGDFSPVEVEKAISKGYKEINLGTSRLRTETAGIVACHTINLINQ